MYEKFGPLGEHSCLVIDGPLDELCGEPSFITDRIAALPAPVIGFVQSERAVDAKVPHPLDLVIGSESELGQVLAGVEQSPHAAATLVQLLRLGEKSSVAHALWSESFAYSTLQSGPEFTAWLADRPRKIARAHAAAEGPAVLVERDDKQPVELKLTLNRPGRRNAFSAEMRDALAAALSVGLADVSVEGVTLDGRGESFCSGGDLDEFGDSLDPATAHAIRSTRNIGRMLHEFSGRSVAQVHGACVGAGIELPAFCGRVVARRGAFFQLPEVSMGLVPGAGGTVSIPRRIGRGRTVFMALSGARIDAVTALDWGLVDEIDDAI